MYALYFQRIGRKLWPPIGLLKRLAEFGRDSRGTVAIVFVLLLVALIGLAALAIDVGYWFSSKEECQNAADAAALAGSSKMLTWNSAFKVDGVDPIASFAEAQSLSLNKQNSGTSLDIQASDCRLGWRDFSKRSLEPSRTYFVGASRLNLNLVSLSRK